jgi:hypothetical protein
VIGEADSTIVLARLRLVAFVDARRRARSFF